MQQLPGQNEVSTSYCEHIAIEDKVGTWRTVDTKRKEQGDMTDYISGVLRDYVVTYLPLNREHFCRAKVVVSE